MASLPEDKETKSAHSTKDTFPAASTLFQLQYPNNLITCKPQNVRYILTYTSSISIFPFLYKIHFQERSFYTLLLKGATEMGLYLFYLHVLTGSRGRSIKDSIIYSYFKRNLEFNVSNKCNRNDSISDTSVYMHKKIKSFILPLKYKLLMLLE